MRLGGVKSKTGHVSDDSGVANDSSQPRDVGIKKTIESEEPFVVLKPKSTMIWMALMFVVCCTIYAIFGAIIPVISGGDFNSVYTPSNVRIYKKMILFYNSIAFLVFLPSIAPAFNIGTIYFFKDRIYIDTYLKKKNITIYYNKMVAIQYGSCRIKISKYPIPSITNPIIFYSNQFIHSLSISILPYFWRNPDKIQKAINIIKDNSLKFKIGNLPF